MISETELQMAALGLKKPDLNLSKEMDKPEESDKLYGDLKDTSFITEFD